jgi:hypothetical protein
MTEIITSSGVMVILLYANHPQGASGLKTLPEGGLGVKLSRVLQ